MCKYFENAVTNIKSNKRVSGKTMKFIKISDSLHKMYGTTDPLQICYMVANNITNTPTCEECKKAKVSFISTKKGFRKFCLCCSRKRTSNRNSDQNKNKNIQRSQKYKASILPDLSAATEYYVNNNCTIKQAAEKYNISHNYLRKYIHENEKIKSNNCHYFVKNNFIDNTDIRLFDKNYLQKCVDNKIPLQVVADELGVAKNTVRIYALKHDIIFSNFNQTEKEIIDFISGYDMNCGKTRKIISPYEIDVYSETYKFGIELNGEYWHSENKKNKNYHLNKQILAENNNIRLIQIYYTEWIDKKHVIKSIIKSFLNKNDKLYARKCTFKSVPKKEAKLFFNNNHLQGWVECKHVFGLYYNDILVSALSIGKSRYNKNYEWEILRFCNVLNTNVIGGFSKLLKNVIKKLDIQSMITYSHRRLFSGDCYIKSGMTKYDSTPPGYFWYNNKTRDVKTRYMTQKHKLNTTLTEKEYMTNLGYVRVYDCGQNVYVYDKRNRYAKST